jgi:hypothetical protein
MADQSHGASKALIAKEMASSLALNRGLFEDFNVTWTDRRGRSLLHHAVLRCDYRLVQDMLIAGTSVFCKDRVRVAHKAVIIVSCVFETVSGVHGRVVCGGL